MNLSEALAKVEVSDADAIAFLHTLASRDGDKYPTLVAALNQAIAVWDEAEPEPPAEEAESTTTSY